MSRQSAEKMPLERLPVLREERRGRPTDADIATRPPALPVRHAIVQRAPKAGIICPGCDEPTLPKKKGNAGDVPMRLQCCICRKYFDGWYEGGKLVLARPR